MLNFKHKYNFVFQTIEYAIIDAVSKLSKVLFIPALAYLIDKDMLGEFSLFMAILPFISLGLGLNIPNFFRHLVLKKPNEIGNLFSTFIFYSIIPFLTGIIICLFCCSYFYLMAVIVSFIFNICMAYNFYLLGKDNRYLYLRETLIINTLIYVPILLLLLFYPSIFKDLNSLIFSLIISSFLAVSYTLYRLLKLKLLGLKLISRSTLNYLVQKNIPLIFHGLSGFGLIYADRFFLKYYYSNDIVANYTVIYSYTLIFSFILVSINNNIIPKYYNLLESGGVKAKLEKNIMIFSLMSLLLVFPVYYIASLLVPQNINFNFWTFFIISISYFFVSAYNIKANVLLYREKTKTIALLSLISFSINLILNFIFIPILGEMGAALSTMISYLILAILYIKFTIE